MKGIHNKQLVTCSDISSMSLNLLFVSLYANHLEEDTAIPVTGLYALEFHIHTP
jgi:hypothetical protein